MFDRDKYCPFTGERMNSYKKIENVSFETGRESRRRIRKENRKKLKHK